MKIYSELSKCNSFSWSFASFSGLGFALSYTPAIAMVGVYFSERKALAYGIAMSGIHILSLSFRVLSL